MGAVADAVLAEGGPVIGVIPEFLKTPDKVHDRLTKLYTVKTMEDRKRRMIDLGEAFIALPGGPGTLEEISEIMSLRRLKKCTAPYLIYNVSGYYDPVSYTHLDVYKRQAPARNAAARGNGRLQSTANGDAGNCEGDRN